MEDQTRVSKGREGRIPVELDKLLHEGFLQGEHSGEKDPAFIEIPVEPLSLEGFMQAKPLQPPHCLSAATLPSSEEHIDHQRRSQELSLRVAEHRAAMLKAAAEKAEADAQTVRLQALATRAIEEASSVAAQSEWATLTAQRSPLRPGYNPRNTFIDSSKVSTMPGGQRISVSGMATIPEAPAEKNMEPSNTGKQQSHSEASEGSEGLDNPDFTNTTVMLRNMPCEYTLEKLLSLLDSDGFNGSYDFVYFPADFISQQGFGYAFVNCVSNREAHRIMDHFQRFAAWPRLHVSVEEEASVCEVSWGDPLQGYQAYIDHYRNSPVMHKDVPETCKPAVFEKGVRIEFPAPTKRIRKARLKLAARRTSQQ
jgi:hypothetical protein